MHEKNTKSNGENTKKVTTLADGNNSSLTKKSDIDLNLKSNISYYLQSQSFSLNFWGEGPTFDELVFTNV